MKNKRNQIIITALAIMIAIAGYINYTGSLSDIISIKDKDSVTASNEIDDEYVSGETLDITSTDEDLDVPGDGEVPGTAILTSAQISSAKLSREQIRAKNKEDLTEQFVKLYSLANILYANYNLDNYYNLMQYYLNLALSIDMDSTDIINSYLKKLNVNHNRQKNNY